MTNPNEDVLLVPRSIMVAVQTLRDCLEAEQEPDDDALFEILKTLIIAADTSPSGRMVLRLAA